MSKSRATIVALSVLLMTGAGCLSLGGDKAPTTAAGGVWLSETAGESWVGKSVFPTAEGINSINGLDILSIEQDPKDASTLYVGSKTSGVFYSLDGGESWARPEDDLASTGSILDIEVDPRNICTYFILKTDRLMKTTTCGREFDNEAYVETRAEEGLTSIAIDWYNPNTIYLGTTQGDILKSTDGGSTWAAAYRANGGIMDIQVSNADSRIVLAGTRSRGVVRSTDSGATWTDLKDELSDFSKAANVYDFSQTASGDRILMRGGYGLLYSDDNGGTWNAIPLVTSSGEVTVQAAALDPKNKNNMYYATSTTFYASTSGGTAWSTANLPSTRAASVIHVDAADSSRVFLGVVSLEK